MPVNAVSSTAMMNSRCTSSARRFTRRCWKTSAGGRTRQSVHHYCAALLSPQPRNPYDHHAVAVTIYGLEVGHLDRELARDFGKALNDARFADAACEALIVGGWDRGGHDKGYFGVRLNAYTPFSLYPAREWHSRRKHQDRGSRIRLPRVFPDDQLIWIGRWPYNDTDNPHPHRSSRCYSGWRK